MVNSPEKNIRQTPLVDAVLQARQRGLRPMQIPGHKYRYVADGEQAFGGELLNSLVRDDVALQGGADDNAYSGGHLIAAEKLYADAIGAEHTRFLVGGSSQGNIAAFLAIGGDDVPVVVDRTSHRSALAGLILSGSRPVWVMPSIHPEFGIPNGMDFQTVVHHADSAAAVFVTSPAYVGTLSNIAALARECHARQIPLVIDQAWGAHLDFGVRGVPSALRSGADLVITSIHKALLGYSQTATISSRGNLIDAQKLDRAVDLTATTSPSATLLASIDATRAVMEVDGLAELERVTEIVGEAHRRLARIPGVVVLNLEPDLYLDPLKITLWLPRTGFTGTEIAQVLWESGVGVETADSDTLVMSCVVGDTAEHIDFACRIIEHVLGGESRSPRPSMPAAVWRIEPDVVMTPRQAAFAARERVELALSVGRISAEQFCPYPPGVPIIGPGERITQEIIDGIAVAAGVGRVAYSSDPTLRTIQVVCQ